MILTPTPIRTPCCHRLAMRTVMTVIDLDNPHHEGVSGTLKRKTLCPHCGTIIAREEGERIHGFRGRMLRYIFAGIPSLATLT